MSEEIWDDVFDKLKIQYEEDLLFHDVQYCNQCAYLADCDNSNWKFCPFNGRDPKEMYLEAQNRKIVSKEG